MRRRTPHPLVFVIVAIALAVTTIWQRSDDAPAPQSQPQAQQQQPRQPSQQQRQQEPPAQPEERATPPQAARDWPRVHAEVQDPQEREQLLATLALVERNGPFPYPRKDGTTFGNRERRLPQKPGGYYREYTVPTPGAKNRGARRVIRGKEGETYYTRDHYDSFIRIDD